MNTPKFRLGYCVAHREQNCVICHKMGRTRKVKARKEIVFNEAQQKAVIDLLWDYLSADPNYPRVRTGWGTKTKEGLIACIQRICENDGL